MRNGVGQLRQRVAAALRGVKATLRRPATITAELCVVAVGCVALAALPQTSRDAEAVEAFAEASPRLGEVAAALRLHDVLHASWFIAASLLATASLLVIVVDGWARALRQWRARPGEAAFASAPFRREVRRPVAAGAGARFESSGRVGLLGSPLFHTGLVLVLLAGVTRMLFGADAAVDVVEGETLGPDASAFAAQWPGPLARPFAWREPLTFTRVAPEVWTAGNLKALDLEVATPRGPERLGVNRPLEDGSRWMYVTAQHGAAALLEWDRAGQVSRRAALTRRSARAYTAALRVSDGSLVRLYAARDGAALPGSFDVRVVRDGALLAVGDLRPGQHLALPGGERLTLHGVRWWARLRGSHDPSVPIVYAGFVLLAVGALLMFGVVRVDKAAIVRREGEGEVVLLALRAHRFAPLYAEAFERWCAENVAGRR